MCLGKKATEVRVSSGGLGQESEVPAICRFVGARGSYEAIFAREATSAHCDLCSGNGLDRHFPCGSREFHASVQPIVIRQSKGWIAQLVGPDYEFLRVRGSVEEGVARVGMQLDVRWHRH